MVCKHVFLHVYGILHDVRCTQQALILAGVMFWPWLVYISTLPGKVHSLKLQQLSNLLLCALCLMHIHCFADLR